MARPRSERYDDVKRQILEAAAALFARQGYLNTNIAEIGGACRASKSRMYHYFAGKSEMLGAMLLEHARELAARARAVVESDVPDERKLVEFIAVHVDFYLGNPDRHAVLLRDAGSLAPADGAALKKLERQLVAMLETLLGRLGGAPLKAPGAASAHAMLVYGMLNWTYTWYHPRGTVKPAELARFAASLCLHGILPRPMPRTVR